MRVVGVDIGGTFTDLMLYDTTSRGVHVHKVHRPRRPGTGDGLGARRALRASRHRAWWIAAVFHGTTVATNAVLEHQGAVAGMITTRGFRDIVHIGRHQRPLHYSIMQDIPWQARPFVKRRHRKVVSERIVPPTGEVLRPLDEEEVRAAARALRDEGVEAVAVCFLFSYLNPEHERRAAAIVREEMPGRVRDDERRHLPAVPRVRALHDRHDERVRRARPAATSTGSRGARGGGVAGELHVMMSNGGVASAATAAEKPVTLLLSGPAAGVLGGPGPARSPGRSG